MASNAIVGTLKVLLTANTAEFQTALERSAKTAGNWEKSLGKMGRSMTNLGTQLTKTLTVPIAGLGLVSSKLAIEFESSFAGIIKTVDDATDEFGNLTDAGKALQQGMRDLAKTIPINVNELNRIGEAAGQLGIETENILGFTETMAKLGVTTSLSAEEAAVSLAQLANITQMPQTQFDRLGATIVHLGNNLATNETKIVDFGLRIASAGELAGMSEHQILSIGAAMASVGVEAEAGGTAVQKVLNGMTEAVAVGGKQLEIFAATAGMSAAQFKDAWKEDAGQAFAAFVSGLGREGDNAFKILDGLGLGNERVIRSFLSLANAGDTLTRSLALGADGWRENSALTEEARKRFETTASQLVILRNNLSDVGITIGNALRPAIEFAIAALEKLIPILDAASKWFESAPAGLQLVTIGFFGLLAAIGPVIFAMGQLALASAAVTGAFGRQAAATTVLGGALRGFAGMALIAARGATVLGTAFAGWKLGEWMRDLGGVRVEIGRVTEVVEQLGIRALTTGEKVQFLAVRLSNWDLATNDIITSIITSRDQFRLMGESADRAALNIVRGAQRSVPAQQNVRAATDAVALATAEWDRILGGTNATMGTAENRATALAAAYRDLASATDDAHVRGLTFREMMRELSVDLDTPPPPDFMGIPSSLDQILSHFEQVELGTYETTEVVESSWNRATHRMLEGFSSTIEGMVTKSISLKDGLLDIFDQIMRGFVSNLLNPMMQGLSNALGSMGGMFSGMFGGGGKGGGASAPFSLGNLFKGIGGGLLMGGIGGLAMGGISALTNWIGGLFRGNTTKKARDEFASQFGGDQALWNQLREAGRDDLVNQALNVIGKDDRAANEQWMRDVVEALDAFASKTEAARQEAERLGLTWEDLGDEARTSKIGEMARDLLETTTQLQEEGYRYDRVIASQADQYSNLLSKALEFGATVPESMRPILQQLIDMGLLVDANGNAISALADEWFTVGVASVDAYERARESWSQGFDVPVILQDTPGASDHGIPGGASVPVPGFDTGSDWTDFGAGQLAMLHNIERVQTPAQAFAERTQHRSEGVALAQAAGVSIGALTIQTNKPIDQTYIRGPFRYDFAEALRSDPNLRRDINRGLAT